MLRKLCFGLASLLIVCLLSSTVVEAVPNQDEVGLCYLFTGDELTRRQPCILSTGYGTGIHYAALTWSDGMETLIETDMSNEPSTVTVNGQRAQDYLRDASWLNITEVEEDGVVYCSRVVASNISYCYRFNDAAE